MCERRAHGLPVAKTAEFVASTSAITYSSGVASVRRGRVGSYSSGRNTSRMFQGRHTQEGKDGDIAHRKRSS